MVRSQGGRNMIIVLARLTVQADKKTELLALAQNVIAATRQESGCLSYSLLDDRYNPTACMFVEQWQDKPALQQHLQTAHIREWRQKSKDLLAAATVIKVYEAEEAAL